ncbi:MAG TPA: PQQ-dependent sugar dehydrogenase [Hyphomicrobium sp.]|nr:PQQ-dependent sugar dehydrogenase [Hyphomicrobium sp.]HRO51327.1 PQQ-dependent sugar dehydrogenase [Hyphomicrobium sp.]
MRLRSRTVAPVLFLMAASMLGASMSIGAQTNAPEAPKTAITLTPVAEGLERPWGLQFLPDGRYLVTELPGRLRVVGKDGSIGGPITGVPEVYAENQGGLLDVALAPDFIDSGTIFLSYSEVRGDGASATAVARGKLTLDGANGALSDVKVIFRQEPPVPGSDRHFGSRLVFTPDGNLFVTTGDRGDRPDEAQNPASTVGKILYMTQEGKPALDKPAGEGWNPLVWSIGHRSVQGATYDTEKGLLWTAEHGPQGGDEINATEKGKNYGWPVITYGIDYSGAKIGEGITEKEGLEQPVYHWTPSIAVSSVLLYTGDLFPEWKGNLLAGALKYMQVQRLVIEDGKVVQHEVVADDIGQRVRDVRQGPDGAVYLLTDEADGRIVRMAPAASE